jgi:hypothetical protein
MSDFSFISSTTIGAGLTFLGAWDASTNTPTLASGVGTAGEYYIVSVAGTTNLDGITNWQVADWAIFSSTGVWQKIDNSNVQAYSLIQDEGINLTQQSILDFQGSGVTATNGIGKTIVTVQSYNTIQEEGVSLPQQPILNFVGTNLTATNGVGKTTVTLNSVVSGTLNRLAMFTPNGTSVGDAPFKVGNSTTRLFGTNTGTDSINIGYGNIISGTDSVLIGYDLADGGGQEIYSFGNRLTISGTAYAIMNLGFLNNFSGSTQGAYVLGDSNTFTTSTIFTLVIGENNTLDSLDQSTIIGNNNTPTNLLNCRVIGSYNNITNGDQLYVVGDYNDLGSISLNSVLNLLGNFNTIDGSTNLGVLGYNNDIISTNDCTILGSFNTISGISNKTIIATGGVKGGVVIDNLTGNVGIGTLFSSSLTSALTVRGNMAFQLSGTMTMPNGFNFVFGTGSGTRLGTAANQRIGFWNVTPIVQPTTATAASSFAAGVGGTAVTTNSTYDGYTLAKVVKALRNLGLLA